MDKGINMDYQECIKRFSMLLEDLAESDGMFDPDIIYNVYYALYLSQMYSDIDIEDTAQELKQYYLKTFRVIVINQLKKYSKRQRVSGSFKEKDIESNDFGVLNDLMKNTFRSDMTRLNKRWIELTSLLADLNTKRKSDDILLTLDRINNTIHNTGEKMFTKFSNPRELLQAFERAHMLEPKELKRYVTDMDLKRKAREYGEEITF